MAIEKYWLAKQVVTDSYEMLPLGEMVTLYTTPRALTPSK